MHGGRFPRGRAGSLAPVTAPDLIPAGLRELVLRHVPDPGMPEGRTWLDRLPRLVEELLADWSLRRDGNPMHGYSALVLPVRRDDGSPAALKVVWPHPEGRDEHLALRAWGGRGAVRLLAADPSRWALLLERLDHTRDLEGRGALEACEEIGRLLSRLDRPAPPWARPLSEHLAELAVDAERARDTGSFPRRLLDQGRSLALELAGEPDVDDRLVHEDLHQQNVLWRPDPGEWVAIDPHVVSGTPAYAVAPVLWNQWALVQRAHDPRVHLSLRVDTLCEAAGIDPARARSFAIVRLVRNALWALAAPHDGTERELTQAVTVIKAMQPG